MTKHVLFVLHGMGLHESSWFEQGEGPWETLKSASRKYKFFQSRPLDELVDRVIVNYDDVFRNLLGRWQADTRTIQEYDPTNTIGDSLSWLANCAETDKNFFWTHVVDVAMYRCIPVYRQAVRITVIKQIADKIVAALAADPATRFSVLAHSLGTAVTHDSLHLLGTKNWDNHANALNPVQFRFANIFMVANVSRLLQTEDAEMRPVYKSIVRPGRLGNRESYCVQYHNFRHEADPFAFPRAFEPADWKNYENVVIRHYRRPNIHDLSHYLLNPSVHVSVLRALVGNDAVTPHEHITAVNPDNFPQLAGSFSFLAKAQALAATLGDLQRSLGEDPPNRILTSSFSRFGALVEAAS